MGSSSQLAGPWAPPITPSAEGGSRPRCPLWLLAALISAGAGAGCELGPSDLAAYSRTAAGPAKIRVVIEEPSYADELRAEAVVTLLDLQREDVEGEKLAMASLSRLPVGSRQGVLEALLSRLGPRLAAESTLPEAGQVRAKDALHDLCLLSEDGVRARYGELLVEWYARSLPRRAHAGRHDLAELVDDLGELAAAPLTRALHARLPAVELRQIASLLAGVAHGKARHEAAQKLINIETRWRSDGRVALLEAELRDAMATGDLKPVTAPERGSAPQNQEKPGSDSAKQAQTGQGWLRAQADSQRHRELETALLPALGWFADTDAVAARLLTLAGSEEANIPEAQRELALRLLTEHTRPEQVGELLTLATDRERPVPLRELALARAAEHAGSGALPQLLAIMSDRRHRNLRQKAAEQVLEIGGSGALVAFFRAMPKAWATDYPRSELEAYSQRLADIPPDPHTVNFLASKLHSPYWWARVLALRYFAQNGDQDDLWRIRQHVHDLLLVRGSGFPDGYTIGQEAQAAVAVALRRLRSGG